MEQALVRKLKPGTLAAYRALAVERQTSLEAELRTVIETHAPKRAKDVEALTALSRGLRLRTHGVPSDSTPFLRQARDTNAGRLDPGE
ncbi:hypothetical protein OKW76_01900 [Sphingomonas sp. S1-29]|uniref:hypothetical protein n=1 Tax=Sphingomonas sp. S1-29 TaxID=2991074 RepID=UPI00223EEDB7|nr:hypothetical protein [Sphingomonas sp. S1-29]UZK69840.1 hypothetical protein OKW76_01900 [Sphingomonas sp. S1-29]